MKPRKWIAAASSVGAITMIATLVSHGFGSAAEIADAAAKGVSGISLSVNGEAVAATVLTEGQVLDVGAMLGPDGTCVLPREGVRVAVGVSDADVGSVTVTTRFDGTCRLVIAVPPGPLKPPGDAWVTPALTAETSLEVTQRSGVLGA
ncbi:MAG: hypothetical protein KatS3mg014_2602 [Actinomycetota bacterium]|nr:MAG: hypothetical protein KatS3mg014_2602 [Actinomycetota bacterium]